ncbi:MAG TPA: alginate export family protein [Nitrosomonas europaea]|uniref:alginate export family protein n=1 Tax=Nitrosomonas europaea TaxID=915 RepID=UPI002492B284|nr:alginate export family protein [Nitrosomonas europaea]HRN81793.1 alginate export family protein [Nitrosomonas europaea]HRO55380.1 alginate export family protein [Nitrosomonas europaea]HRQ08029.1 alginate export family protein [Nitrosomonas europaea]HUM73106.1 alginate export family protein [Nitrosomonas europaea]
MHTTDPAGWCSNRNSLIRKLLTSFIGSSSGAVKICRKAAIVSFILATGSSQLFASGSSLAATQVDWSKAPPVSPPPRAGIFVKPPMGPGYFSLLDLIDGNEREKPQVDPLPPSALTTTPAFDFDFRYLEQPGHDKDFFDPVKRIHLGSDWLLSFGGSFWYRYMHETDSRLNAAGINNDYHLLRTRLHADLWYQDQFRLFAEMLDARALGLDLSALAIDKNHTDMLNLFADVKLGQFMDGPAYLRVGRQELLYGSQRLISTLDWANTRRTFQGVKTFWQTPAFNLDAFWVRPMVTEPNQFDNWDKDRNFVGLWGTYKAIPGQVLDLYYLSLIDNRNVSPANITQGNVLQGDSVLHTIGARWVGDYERILYELEGMYQFGKRSHLDISAFSIASGVGYQLPLPMNPQFWLRYDFASGDKNHRDGRSNTFNQLFPFGHYYFGYIDQVGRQNIHDFNAQFTLHPQPWVTFLGQYHRFYLANKRDYLYNAAGAGTIRDITGQSGSHIGDEIDFTINFHLSRHQDVLLGYSKLFTGEFLKNTRPGVSPDLFYAQYNFRF